MRKIISTLSFLFLLLCCQQSFGQRVCGSVFNAEQVQLTDKSRYQRFLELEQRTEAFKKAQRGGANGGTEQGRLINANSTIIIPVVVHVIHDVGQAVGTGRNISVAQIQSQIDVLNEDFRRTNADAVNTPAGFLGVAADPNIEFRLACVDPNGNATTGITRTATSVSVFSTVNDIKFNATGGHDAWATNRYLNIWVGSLPGTLLGQAQFPFDYASNPNTDGVVIRTTAFGRVGNVSGPFDEGRTATHEVGHWLNLFHIWGDDGNACSGSDQCNDTPNQADENYSCPSSASSCSNGGDMFMNYMDYTDDGCMNLFTNDQRTRMRAVFASGGPRASFINNYLSINYPPGGVTVCSSINLTISNPMCLAVTWSIVSGPAQITSGQGTNTVTVSGTGVYDGPAVVHVTAGGYEDDITINVGLPMIDFMTFANGADDGWYFCTSHTGNQFTPSLSFTGTGSIEWRLLSWPSLSVVYTDPTWYTSGSPISVGSSYTPGWYVLEARLHHACGTTPWTGFEVEFINCSEPGGGGCPDCGFRLLAAPNPAEGDITVSIENITPDVKALSRNTEVKYVLYDFTQARAVRQWTFDNGQSKRTLNVRGLKSGQYVLVVTKGKFRRSTKIIIK